MPVSSATAASSSPFFFMYFLGTFPKSVAYLTLRYILPIETETVSAMLHVNYRHLLIILQVVKEAKNDKNCLGKSWNKGQYGRCRTYRTGRKHNGNDERRAASVQNGDAHDFFGLGFVALQHRGLDFCGAAWRGFLLRWGGKNDAPFLDIFLSLVLSLTQSSEELRFVNVTPDKMP